MLRHILIRPADAKHGGDVMVYSATELCSLYGSDELARFAIGRPVQRDGIVHVDLMAFYDRHATPDARGSVFLMQRLRAELGEVA